MFVTDDEDLYEGSGLDIDEDEEDGSGSGDGSLETGSVFHHRTNHESSWSEPKKPLSQEEKLKFREEFYHKHDMDILRLDTSCVIQFKEAPEIKNADIR